MLEQLYKQIVMDHYKHPRNWGKLESEHATRTPYKNPTCGDVVVLYTNIDEQERIRDIRFEGEGCSISMASCSMMTELVKGKTLSEAEELIRQFTEMIRFGKMPDDEDKLGDALALSGVHKLKARHNCSLLGWNGLNLVIRKARSESE